MDISQQSAINEHVSAWKTSALIYRIAIGIVITIFLLIVFIWLVIEIYSIRRRQQLRIKSVRDKMDGIEAGRRLSINKAGNNSGISECKRERKIALNANPNNSEARELLIGSVDNTRVNFDLKTKVNFDLVKKLSDIDEEGALETQI